MYNVVTREPLFPFRNRTDRQIVSELVGVGLAIFKYQTNPEVELGLECMLRL